MRKESAITPDLFDSNNNAEEYNDPEDVAQREARAKNKRRGSVENTDLGPAMTDEAIEKRNERQAKHHKRDSSIPTPNIWDKDYSNDALQKHEERTGKGIASLHYIHIYCTHIHR